MNRVMSRSCETGNVSNLTTYDKVKVQIFGCKN